MSAYASRQTPMRYVSKLSLILLFLAALHAQPALAQADAQEPEPFGALAPRTFVQVNAIPNLVTFRLAPSGVSTGSTPANVTTLWRLRRGNVLTLYAYFTIASKALTSGAAGS